MFPSDHRLRLATPEDVPRLEALLAVSIRELQADSYSEEQRAAAAGVVFGVDRQLILDGTYFVVEAVDTLIGCGGWSRRQAVFGGDAGRPEPGGLIDPATDPARIRAFFVHPDWARRGVASAILQHCEAAIADAGFSRITMVATLAGEPFYSRHHYVVEQRYEVPLPGGLGLPVVRMGKRVPPHGGQ